MQEDPHLTAALAAICAASSRAQTASDAELLADLALVERLGRVVDGLRHRAAAEVEHRSRRGVGEESLAFRFGARDGVELVQRVARIDARTAKRRIGLGAATAPGVALDGALLPGRLPEVRAAIEAGDVGVESARVIANTVKAIHRRVTADRVADMVEALLDTARTADTEVLHEVAELWALALDPDGAEPREAEQRRRRAVQLGRTLGDGTTRMSVVLPPEDLAMFKELFASRRRGRSMIRIEPASDATDDDLGPEWRPEDADDRTRPQQDYDTLVEVVQAGIRAEHDGTASTAVTHEVVVTIGAAELEARQGQGWTAGVLAGLPVPVIERRICTGGLRLMVTGPEGEPLHLSRSTRVFTAAQRKALSVAAGGRCEFPGCRVTSPYLEAHHARWWHRDHGPTDVVNGVMLCSFHHHLVHAKRPPVEIRRHAGSHWFVPSGWRGDPSPQHRAAARAPGGPPPPRRARADDPWGR
ncbi:DUF222 domain-containing protein [Amnibacterium endophyticum]|uniref:DUF222 domain-containing protein n=1 Tax=Amnibacterium endophyticum TaxID=2109337 RepID=A0ABW4LH17_9MICO